jgi:FkbM family methyltransferase
LKRVVLQPTSSKLFGAIFDGLYFLPNLFSSDISKIKKVKILLAYIQLTIKLVLFDPIKKLKNENIFGFKLRFFDYYLFHLLFRVIFLKNEYFFKSDKKNLIILDCGANIGISTLYFKWLHTKSEIHAFEPDIKTFNLLKENVEQSKLKNVHVYNVALSDRNGKASFFIDKENPGSLRMSMKFERMSKDRVEVNTIALSQFIQNEIGNREIDFIKIDIEGSEDVLMEDLNGNNKLKMIKEMVIEYHHRMNGKSNLFRFLEILEDNGFGYKIEAYSLPNYCKDNFQNIIIHASRI